MGASVLAAACFLGTAAWASDLVGTIVPPYPGGLSSNMGSCIAQGGDPCAYSIAALNDTEQAVAAIAALQLVERIDGRPVWRITDVHGVPQAEEGQMWAFEECRLEGDVDPSVVGLVTVTDKGGWIDTGETLWALKLDVETGRLAMPELPNVRCVMPGS